MQDFISDYPCTKIPRRQHCGVHRLAIPTASRFRTKDWFQRNFVVDESCFLVWPHMPFTFHPNLAWVPRQQPFWTMDTCIAWRMIFQDYNLIGLACKRISHHIPLHLTADFGIAQSDAPFTVTRLESDDSYLIILISNPRKTTHGQIIVFFSFGFYRRWWDRCFERQLDVLDMDDGSLPVPNKLSGLSMAHCCDSQKFVFHGHQWNQCNPGRCNSWNCSLIQQAFAWWCYCARFSILGRCYCG